MKLTILFIILLFVCQFIRAQDASLRKANQLLSAQPAPEWTALFDRDYGWTGSDACYSIPKSGYDAAGGLFQDSTIFVFGDTFIGEVGENGARLNSVMIRNTMAILHTKNPDPDSIHFYWNIDAQNQPAPLVLADTPDSEPDDWIWPMDGIALNDTIFIFGIRIRKDGILFQAVGTTLISFSLDSNNQIENYRQIDAPLFFENEAQDVEIVLGQAIMSMTTASGNPNPDGYIYVFGANSHLFTKDMVVSRVIAEEFQNFDAWEFWDGNAWGAQVENCAALTDSISQEFSVTPLDDGRFMVTFVFGNDVYVRYSDTITGPYGPAIKIYTCPETSMYTGAIVYNGKAHPHLSTKDEMLISYNVNTTDWGTLLAVADAYHPRFISYYWRDNPSIVKRRTGMKPVSASMQQNYPNPFNSTTILKYALGRDKPYFQVQLNIFNSAGQQVTSLVAGRQAPGDYQVSWDAGDLASGIYYAALVTDSYLAAIKKIVLIK